MEKHQELVCPPAAFSPTPTGEENGLFLGRQLSHKNNPYFWFQSRYHISRKNFFCILTAIALIFRRGFHGGQKKDWLNSWKKNARYDRIMTLREKMSVLRKKGKVFLGAPFGLLKKKPRLLTPSRQQFPQHFIFSIFGKKTKRWGVKGGEKSVESW